MAGVKGIHPAISPVVTLSDGRSIALLEELGRGSSGIVYRGLVQSGWGLRRPVAVKVFALGPELSHDEAMHHLARTAQRAASIRHPSVVQVFEVDHTDELGDEPSSPFMVTELVEGESLASIVETWRAEGMRVPIDFATVVTLRAAEALGAALFTDGVDGALTDLVHGDLSPRQILISNQGEVRLADFGQFAFTSGASHVRSRARLAYTAPEVACGGLPDARSDVFALGVILHELLVGPRFAANTNTQDAVRMVRDGHLHMNVLEPNLPRTLRDVIERATERNPLDRYPHARAMAFDLRREMLRLGLCDTQTCVRHAIVGWCEVRGEPQAPRQRDLGSRPPAPSGVELVAARSAPDPQPWIPHAFRG
jgi:serine/threonine-protein kinase